MRPDLFYLLMRPVSHPIVSISIKYDLHLPTLSIDRYLVKKLTRPLMPSTDLRSLVLLFNGVDAELENVCFN